jgi:MFS family permease
MLYPDHQAAVIGILEMACGLGMTIAPVIGSLLYTLGGFNAPFLFFGTLFLVISLFVKCFLPSHVDQKMN